MKLNISKRRTFSQLHKGAFIIYPDGGGYDDFEGGHFFFHSLLWCRGGHGKIPMKMTLSMGGQPFFFWKRKENENMPMDALIIPVFYFISTKCWYRTRVWKLMHDTHFLCYKVSLWVAQTHSRHPPQSRSPLSHSPRTHSPHSPRVERWLTRWYSMANCYAVVKWRSLACSKQIFI